MITRFRPSKRVEKRVEKATVRGRKLAKKLPGEFLHRAASFVIICEAIFHTFHKMVPIIVAGIIFVLVEIFGGEVEEF